MRAYIERLIKNVNLFAINKSLNSKLEPAGYKHRFYCWLVRITDNLRTRK